MICHDADTAHSHARLAGELQTSRGEQVMVWRITPAGLPAISTCIETAIVKGARMHGTHQHALERVKGMERRQGDYNKLGCSARTRVCQTSCSVCQSLTVAGM